MSTYEISKSSLLSLKAEILRKQEELSKVKSQNYAKIQQQLKKGTPLDLKNKGVEQRESNDYNEEEENLLKKSRAALEAKSKLYDKLSRGSAQFTDEQNVRNKRFLVRFDQKLSKRTNIPPPGDSDNEMDVDKYPESEDECPTENYKPARNPDEEWVEYIDCLGRTRKCLRKDLDVFKSRDKDLKAATDAGEKRFEETKASDMVTTSTEHADVDSLDSKEISETNELLSGDMRRELLRQQWEEEEEELRNKNDIHYQDILFNEARAHGVGYYGFSKDEEERAKQQEALKKLREQTQQEQKKAQDLKALREKQLAARTKAARNRKRARMGLPPEEDEPEVAPAPEESKLTKEEQKRKAEEEKLEKQKEKARSKHIRPWDLGKEGVREHYEHTQEEWVEKKRKERPKEFAPPNAYRTSFRSVDVEDNSAGEKSDKSLYFSSKKFNKESSKKKTGKSDVNEEDIFYIDTSGGTNPYKTKETYDYDQASAKVQASPIINECIDFDEEQDRLLNNYKFVEQSIGEKPINSADATSSSDEENEERGRGTEIPPPPTMEYYAQTDVKRKKVNAPKGNLAESIAAGLKFLRKQSEKKLRSSNHPDEMFLS